MRFGGTQSTGRFRIVSWAVAGYVTVASAQAGWLDFLKQGAGSTNSSAASPTVHLSADEIASGLKDALAKGAETAIGNLSKTDGFLKNLEVRIPLPDSLVEIEKGLRLVGQQKYADEFVAALNHAAETAVTEAGPIFSEGIRQMTVADAEQILNGGDDAATQYFRKVGESRIQEKMLPVVKAATEKTGVTAAYKNFIGKAGFAVVLSNKKDLDIDAYVTQKATDGLFKMIAVEEKEIRKNPMARTTDLLKKVFGSAVK
ncbi:MAG TPA: DUF4197 domain-containing protein [Verrucomicrobiae bacterium]|nr:DUF4197 domain-containing protein [Verrucomicrobiae bacterium]